MDAFNLNSRYQLAAFSRTPEPKLPAEYVDLYFDRYARISEVNPPSEEDKRLHALLYQRCNASYRERQRLGSKIARFLRDNRLVHWLTFVRGRPRQQRPGGQA
jgi:hypothetical protein